MRPTLPRSLLDGPSLRTVGRGLARELFTLGLVFTVLAVPAFLAILLVPLEAWAKRPAHVVQIYKAERRMVLEVDGRPIRTFRVGLGSAPEGDKVREGDSKTPEGELYVAWKARSSPFHRFLGLSYPMARHAEAGVERGLIKKAAAEQIKRAVKARGIPPQNTRLGGYVGIHGGGGEVDWTLGCIAVSDEEIEQLFDQLEPGDRVVVHP